MRSTHCFRKWSHGTSYKTVQRYLDKDPHSTQPMCFSTDPEGSSVTWTCQCKSVDSYNLCNTGVGMSPLGQRLSRSFHIYLRDLKHLYLESAQRAVFLKWALSIVNEPQPINLFNAIKQSWPSVTALLLLSSAHDLKTKTDFHPQSPEPASHL